MLREWLPGQLYLLRFSSAVSRAVELLGIVGLPPRALLVSSEGVLDWLLVTDLVIARKAKSTARLLD